MFVHFANIKRGIYDVGDNQYGNARAKNLLFVLQQLLKLASNTADHFFNTQGELGAWFFFASAVLFINVHHYFIDNVIWRFSNNRIRQFLLA